jgi:hypothetical protein
VLAGRLDVYTAAPVKRTRVPVQPRPRNDDAAIGFFTIRDGQGDADYTSHIWVRDEMGYASAKEMPVIPIREKGARVPTAPMGNPQFIELDQADRQSVTATF